MNHKIITIIAGISLLNTLAYAQDPYFLDPNFGNAGVAVAPNAYFGNGPYVMNKTRNMRITSDNKIVVAGNIGMFYALQGVSTDHAITRLNPNGTIDSTFNSNGHLVFNATNQPEVKFMDNMLLLPDNKILYAGSATTNANSRTIIYKINTNGSFDSQFGTNGVVRISGPNQFNTLYSLDIQSTGKILLFTSSFTNTSSQGIVTRLNANGSVDNTFGINGSINPSLGFASNTTNGFHMAKVLNDDAFLVVGTNFGANASYADHQYFVAKFNADGSPNTSFGTNGKVIIPRAATERFTFYNRQLDVDTNGNIYVNFSKSSFPLLDTSQTKVLVIKLSSNGVLDANYGVGGRVTIANMYYDYNYYYDAQIQNGNKLLVAAMMDTGLSANYMLKRLNADGTDDLSFEGTSSEIVGTREALDHFHFLGLQSDNKIILGGYGKRLKNGADSIYPVMMRFTNTRETDPVDTGTSVVKIKDQSKISIFPNPVQHVLQIKGLTGNAQVGIFDVSGRLVKNVLIMDNAAAPIDCSQLASGSYWLYISEAPSKTIYSYKFVKQ